MNTSSPTSHYGRYMYFAMWILVLILLSAAFYRWDQATTNPNQSPTARALSADRYEIVLQRNRHGHYVANGTINGVNVTFFLDTGATDISIPGHIADKLKLKAGYKRTYQTANGDIENYTTTLKSISIGAIKRNNIRASINPNAQYDEILLGMSFLKTVELIQRGDTLTIRG